MFLIKKKDGSKIWVENFDINNDVIQMKEMGFLLTRIRTREGIERQILISTSSIDEIIDIGDISKTDEIC